VERGGGESEVAGWEVRKDEELCVSACVCEIERERVHAHKIRK
jgi:hypothetical protein